MIIRTLLTFESTEIPNNLFLYEIRTFGKETFTTIGSFDEFLNEQHVRGANEVAPFNQRTFKDYETAMLYHKAYVKTLKNRKNLILIKEQQADE